MASTASRRGKTTFCFFSLNFSNNAGIQADAYVSKRFFSPLANIAIHFAAMPTIMTFESLVIIYRQNHTNKMIQ